MVNVGNVFGTWLPCFVTKPKSSYCDSKLPIYYYEVIGLGARPKRPHYICARNTRRSCFGRSDILGYFKLGDARLEQLGFLIFARCLTFEI